MFNWLLTIVLLGMPPVSDPTALIPRLGSKDPPEREAAATALEAIGGEALPALRDARDGQDPAIRQQAAALIRKIEGDQLVRPSLVPLNYRDVPMAEVIRDISHKTGCRLRIYELRKDWLAERITLHEPKPVPFWKAVDRLCQTGRFQYNLGSDAGGASVSLFRGETSGPASDHGAFRVQLVAILLDHRYRWLHLGSDASLPRTARDEDRDNSFIRLQVMVEPRMMIRNDDPLRNLSVIDDLGQSLLAADPDSRQDHHDFGLTPTAYVVGQVPLEPAGRPGRMIRKLRGIAPVVVARRRPEPLVIPLAGAVGRSYRSDESLLTIRAVKKITPAMRITVIAPDAEEEEKPAGDPRATAIELTLRPSDRAGDPPSVRDVSEHQFEIVDAAGRVWEPLLWGPFASGPRREGGEIHVQVIPVDHNLTPWRGDIAGARLRYYDMTVAKVGVPFEFADIALP